MCVCVCVCMCIGLFANSLLVLLNPSAWDIGCLLVISLYLYLADASSHAKLVSAPEASKLKLLALLFLICQMQIQIEESKSSK